MGSPQKNKVFGVKIPFKTHSFPSFRGESKRGEASLTQPDTPSPLEERGIKGVRWINN